MILYENVLCRKYHSWHFKTIAIDDAFIDSFESEIMCL